MRKELISKGDDQTTMLSVFRTLILRLGLKEGDVVIFSGCPGTCYAMATFLAFGIRDLGLKIYYAADSDLEQIWELKYLSHLGMAGSRKVKGRKADLIILMSGLMRVPFEKTLSLIREALLPEGKVVGETVIPGLFENSHWDQKIRFEGFFEFEMRNPTAYLSVLETVQEMV